MNEIRAVQLLMRCRGDEVWSVETCREERIPEAWIDELADAYESGFDRPDNTLFTERGLINQYHGVHDLRLAYKLAEFLGIDWEGVTRSCPTRQAEVRALQEAWEEG